VIPNDDLTAQLLLDAVDALLGSPTRITHHAMSPAEKLAGIILEIALQSARGGK